MFKGCSLQETDFLCPCLTVRPFGRFLTGSQSLNDDIKKQKQWDTFKYRFYKVQDQFCEEL